MQETKHGAFTPHGVTKTIFGRVPIRGLFGFDKGGVRGYVKISTTDYGDYPAVINRDPVNPLVTSPTGKVKIVATGSIAATVPNIVIYIGNPADMLADEPLNSE